jgi:hypothetical protein
MAMAKDQDHIRLPVGKSLLASGSEGGFHNVPGKGVSPLVEEGILRTRNLGGDMLRFALRAFAAFALAGILVLKPAWIFSEKR